MNREQWCEVMCRQVRFWPDRRAVREEMCAHMDDKRDALVTSGLSVPEAETAAVAAMGDPEEVGRQINAVHRPLLGWLWKLSGWVLLLAVVFFLFSLTQPFGSYFGNDDSYSYAEYLEEGTARYENTVGGYPHDVVTTGWRLFYDEPVRRGELGSYTVSTERTALWRFESRIGEQVNEWRSLYGVVKVSGFGPAEEPLELGGILYGADSLGNRYEGNDLIFRPSSRTLTAFHYEFSAGRLPADAEWLELRCEKQPDFCLRIDLTGGEDA